MGTYPTYLTLSHRGIVVRRQPPARTRPAARRMAPHGRGRDVAGPGANRRASSEPIALDPRATHPCVRPGTRPARSVRAGAARTGGHHVRGRAVESPGSPSGPRASIRRRACDEITPLQDDQCSPYPSHLSHPSYPSSVPYNPPMRLRVFSSPRFADHLTPPGHPERVDRAAVMQVVAADLRASGAEVVEPRRATDDELLRVHDRDYLTLLRETAGRAVALDPDTFTSPDTYDVARLAAGAAAGAVDYVLEAGRGARALVLVRPPGPSRRARPGDGVLPLQQRRGGRRARPRPRPDAGGDRRLRRASRQRDAVDLLRRPVGAVRLVAPVSVLPGHRRRRRNRQRARDAASR